MGYGHETRLRTKTLQRAGTIHVIFYARMGQLKKGKPLFAGFPFFS